MHFGDQNIAPIIAEHWKKHKKYTGVKKIPLWFRNELTEEILKAETDEVKEEVAQLREQDAEDIDDGKYEYLLDEEGIEEEEVERRENMILLQR